MGTLFMASQQKEVEWSWLTRSFDFFGTPI